MKHKIKQDDIEAMFIKMMAAGLGLMVGLALGFYYALLRLL